MTIDELIKAANEYRKRYDITYSEGVILPLASIMADFAAECIAAERERVAERLQILFEDVVNGSSPVTLLHGVMLTALIDELRGGK